MKKKSLVKAVKKALKEYFLDVGIMVEPLRKTGEKRETSELQHSRASKGDTEKE
jgi:hypothetical protein